MFKRNQNKLVKITLAVLLQSLVAAAFVLGGPAERANALSCYIPLHRGTPVTPQNLVDEDDCSARLSDCEDKHDNAQQRDNCYKQVFSDYGLSSAQVEHNLEKIRDGTSGKEAESVGEGDAHTISNLDMDCKEPGVSSDNCGIIRYLLTFINILSAIVGIVCVIMITVAGIQYSTSRDNPQAVAAARGRIVNTLLALVVYLFMYAFLQWLVPGGIF